MAEAQTIPMRCADVRGDGGERGLPGGRGGGMTSNLLKEGPPPPHTPWPLPPSPSLGTATRSFCDHEAVVYWRKDRCVRR